jgi:hypothetical protein
MITILLSQRNERVSLDRAMRTALVAGDLDTNFLNAEPSLKVADASVVLSSLLDHPVLLFLMLNTILSERRPKLHMLGILLTSHRSRARLASLTANLQLLNMLLNRATLPMSKPPS